MDLDQYELKTSLNPDISETLQPLIDMLVTEWEIWAIKPPTKTMTTITKCKWTLLTLQDFIYDDNWKAAYLTMKREDFKVAELKACFRGNKDKQQKALKIYKDSMLKIINWIHEKLQDH